MAFEKVLSQLKVIDESNFQEQISVISNGERLAGYNPRQYDIAPFTTTMSKPIIRDRKVLKEMAIEKERKEATLAHIFDYMKVPILDQNGLPYCWCYGTTGAEMLCHAIQGGYVPHLSATSVAAKIKNYRKEGGWAKEALEGKAKWGTAELKFWEEHDLSRSNDTEEMRKNALLHKVTNYEELGQNDFEALCTYLLAGIPVTLGLSWWGHLIYAIRVVVLANGELGIEIVNSWGEDWENHGRAILVESKATAHEQIGILSVSPRKDFKTDKPSYSLST